MRKYTTMEYIETMDNFWGAAKGKLVRPKKVTSYPIMLYKLKGDIPKTKEEKYKLLNEKFDAERNEIIRVTYGDILLHLGMEIIEEEPNPHNPLHDYEKTERHILLFFLFEETVWVYSEYICPMIPQKDNVKKDFPWEMAKYNGK